MGELQFGSLLLLPHTSPALLSLLKQWGSTTPPLQGVLCQIPTVPQSLTSLTGTPRASPLGPVSRHGCASRTQHSSAKHTEHDQHSEQAELFSILKLLSKLCPELLWSWLGVRGIPFYGLLFGVFAFLFVCFLGSFVCLVLFFWSTQCLNFWSIFILSSQTFMWTKIRALILAAPS